MTFLRFDTLASHPMWHLLICRGTKKIYDIKSLVINVCDHQNQCHNIMALLPPYWY
jgi:hypothetical protein